MTNGIEYYCHTLDVSVVLEVELIGDFCVEVLLDGT